MPTAVQRSWPRANSAENGGNSSRATASCDPNPASVSGGTRLPARRIMSLTASTAACAWPRRNNQREPAGQCDQPKAVRIAGEEKADEWQQGEGARQHDLVNGAVGTAMLGRHQFGGDRERCRDGKAQTDPGQQPQPNQLCRRVRERD